MPLVTLVSPKGGVGATLVAVNLAMALAARATSVLVDFHLWGGDADLHLDLNPQKDWTDLLSVANELTDRHLELALTPHPGGLVLLAAPEGPRTRLQIESAGDLLASLSSRFDWLVVDCPTGVEKLTTGAIERSDMTLIVTTADPPALRRSAWVRAALRSLFPGRLGLVVNQMNHTHPVNPGNLADSLDVKLLAVLSTDPLHVGYQINFGQPAVLARGSRLGREIKAMAHRLESWQTAPIDQGSDARLPWLEPESR